MTSCSYSNSITLFQLGKQGTSELCPDDEDNIQVSPDAVENEDTFNILCIINKHNKIGVAYYDYHEKMVSTVLLKNRIFFQLSPKNKIINNLNLCLYQVVCWRVYTNIYFCRYRLLYFIKLLVYTINIKRINK